MATQAGFYHKGLWDYLAAKLIADDNCYAILTTATIDPETATIASIVANEYTNTNGYSRQAVDLSGLAATYNSTNNYTNFSTLTSEFEATGSDIIFRSAVLLFGANSTIGNSTGYVAAITQYSSNTTISAGAPTPFTVLWDLQFAHGVYNTNGTNPSFS